MQDDLQQIFAEGGILARQIKGYHPRQAQQEMAQRIADTLASATVLVAEAGTGTGKTFAYLAPAILSDKKSLFPPVLKISRINYSDAIYLPCVKH